MLLFSVQFNRMVPSAENEIIISFIQHIFPVVNVRVYCRVISGRAIGLLPRSLYIVAVTETLERQKKKTLEYVNYECNKLEIRKRTSGDNFSIFR